MLRSIVDRLTRLPHLGSELAEILGEPANALAGVGEVLSGLAHAVTDRIPRILRPESRFDCTAMPPANPARAAPPAASAGPFTLPATVEIAFPPP